ncbi:hypothetical protein LIER_26657 [Lithospermum erythrorhizon]|uniref:Uncharacterized protein n=1 Tax=Lithospermum erythrorhizon TaxID=34254 RepID=A0AAV3R9D3_LITER
MGFLLILDAVKKVLATKKFFFGSVNGRLENECRETRAISKIRELKAELNEEGTGGAGQSMVGQGGEGRGGIVWKRLPWRHHDGAFTTSVVIEEEDTRTQGYRFAASPWRPEDSRLPPRRVATAPRLFEVHCLESPFAI